MSLLDHGDLANTTTINIDEAQTADGNKDFSIDPEAFLLSGLAVQQTVDSIIINNRDALKKRFIELGLFKVPELSVLFDSADHSMDPVALAHSILETQTGSKAYAQASFRMLLSEETDTMIMNKNGQDWGQIIGELARGGCGVTFVTKPFTQEENLVVKATLPETLIRGRSNSARRFGMREIRYMQKLSEREVVPEFVDSGIWKPTENKALLYYSMKYHDADSLSRLYRKEGLPPRFIRHLMSITLSHLDKFRFPDETIVHRDIKPGNVLIADNGRVMIIDPGLAVSDNPNENTLTEANTAPGTLLFMAPEQVRNPEKVDHRADLYSTASSMYYLATGKPVSGVKEAKSFKADQHSWLLQHKESPDCRDIDRAGDPVLGSVLENLLDPDPEKRMSAEAAIHMLSEGMEWEDDLLPKGATEAKKPSEILLKMPTVSEGRQKPFGSAFSREEVLAFIDAEYGMKANEKESGPLIARSTQRQIKDVARRHLWKVITAGAVLVGGTAYAINRGIQQGIDYAAAEQKAKEDAEKERAKTPFIIVEENGDDLTGITIVPLGPALKIRREQLVVVESTPKAPAKSRIIMGRPNEASIRQMFALERQQRLGPPLWDLEKNTFIPQSPYAEIQLEGGWSITSFQDLFFIIRDPQGVSQLFTDLDFVKRAFKDYVVYAGKYYDILDHKGLASVVHLLPSKPEDLEVKGSIPPGMVIKDNGTWPITLSGQFRDLIDAMQNRNQTVNINAK